MELTLTAGEKVGFAFPLGVFIHLGRDSIHPNLTQNPTKSLNLTPVVTTWLLAGTLSAGQSHPQSAALGDTKGTPAASAAHDLSMTSVCYSGCISHQSPATMDVFDPYKCQ